MFPHPRRIFLAFVFASLAGCTVGPDYQHPEPFSPLPEAFKEKGPWKKPVPRDHLPKDEWWKIYNDPALSRLLSAVTKASPTIYAALARLDQARALAGMEASAFSPGISGSASAERARQSPAKNRPAITVNSFSFAFDLRYELDLWGRVRRLDEAAVARVAASGADFHNVLLSVQAETARAYFQLRTLDAERAVVLRNIDGRARSLDFIKRRRELGASDRLDLSLAETELATAEGDLLEIDRLRAARRHELAVLCGTNPSTFSIDENAIAARTAPPPIPVGIPSELLERRPDVASAERALAATCADIGVASAAFYPSIVIFGAAGYGSFDVERVLDWSSRQWSLGPALNVPIFDGGRNIANLRRAEALHAEALARYRQQVLVAFQEVETCLSDLQLLAGRSVKLEQAVASGNRASLLMNERYKHGAVAYKDVADTERLAIANERLAVQVLGQQLVTSVLLVKAVGGGWASEAPFDGTGQDAP
ncbi:MAG: efflux transporter outer membrane subunit [Puniceicoccales bacterium]|jgi:multidrug efflux system outer membrane protein|nr:efflux transporter outer membrane subunit [Puniceicoccales bacterium]